MRIGFIGLGRMGANMVRRLVRDGHEVRAIVIYNSLDSWGWLDTAPAEITSQIEIIPGDIRDPALMTSVCVGVDAVLHLAPPPAAGSTSGPSRSRPATTRARKTRRRASWASADSAVTAAFSSIIPMIWK